MIEGNYTSGDGGHASLLHLFVSSVSLAFLVIGTAYGSLFCVNEQAVMFGHREDVFLRVPGSHRNAL